MHVPLSDKVAIVTGAAHRVGKAIAVELARAGVHLLITFNASPEDVVKAAVRDLKSEGVDAYAVRADLSTVAGVTSVFETLQEHFERLDILVNSASNFQKRTLLEVTLEEWRQTLDINLTAPFLTTQQAIRLMQTQTPAGGVIINIGDKGSQKPWVEYAHHSISKSALLTLTKITAAAYGPAIRANAIIPGLVMKPDGMDEMRWQNYGAGTPSKRPGTPEDIGRAVVYLASEDYITGAVINIDGGESVV